MLLVYFSAYAQNASWNYSVGSGNLGDSYEWIDCSDGVELNATNLEDYNPDYLPEDDARWSVVWPFDFKFYDDKYNAGDIISISTNGFIRFDAYASLSYERARNYRLNARGIGLGQIVALGVFDADFSDDNSHCFIKLTGIAPNRKLIIEFQDMSSYDVDDVFADVQVEFHEGTNKVVLKVGESSVPETAMLGIHSAVEGYFFDWQDTRYSTENTWIEFTPPSNIPISRRETSYVDDAGIVQPVSSDIPSAAHSEGTAKEVFRFVVFDNGDDGKPTEVQKIRIRNNNSTLDWYEKIAGVVLKENGRKLDLGMVAVHQDYLDILVQRNQLVVSDGGKSEISMSIYLKNTGRDEEGQTFHCYFNPIEHGWTADYSGSGFAANFGGTSFSSEVFTVSYTPTHLMFITQPISHVHMNNVLAPSVQVAVADVAGNIDTQDNTTEIKLSNIESVGMSGVTARVVNGVATFQNLLFTDTGGPFELYAKTNVGYEQAISSNITVTIKASLFFDDFERDRGWVVRNNFVWERGRQFYDDSGPRYAYSGFRCYGTVLNGAYGNNVDAYLTSPTFDLSATTSPQITFWMDMESQYGLDGGTVQLRVLDGSGWSNWTTIDKDDKGYYGTTPNHTDIDGMSNGVDGWTGNVPSDDWTIVGIDLFNLRTPGLTHIDAEKKIQLRFWFGSNDKVMGNGWYIDDFEISHSVFHGLWKKNAISTDWNTKANWDDGQIPDKNTSVQIPANANFYPIVDEEATCRKVIIYEGGELTVAKKGKLKVERYLSVSTGGEFSMKGGVCDITEDFFTQENTTVSISDGKLNFVNWAYDLNDQYAKGNIQLSGGEVTAKGNVLFASENAGGYMRGNFLMKILGNYSSHYNDTDKQWSEVSGGTIVMKGNSTTYIESSSRNKAIAYNLRVKNSSLVATRGDVKVFGNCILFPSSSFTVSEFDKMEVVKQLYLKTNKKKVASLIDFGELSVGKSRMDCYLEQGRWYGIASPVKSASLDIFNKHNFFYYNEQVKDRWLENNFLDENGNRTSNSGWTKAGQVHVDQPMLGFFTYYNHRSPTIQFAGDFNTGDLSISLSYTESGYDQKFDGWNLVGNPYPSAIDLSKVSISDVADAAFYIFEDDGTSNYDRYSYYVPGALGSPYPGVAVNSKSAIVAANQAFFLKTKTGGGTFRLSNDFRVHNRDLVSKKNEVVHPDLLRISILKDGKEDETVLRIIPESTMNFDGSFDAIKLKNPGKKSTEIFTRSPLSERLAINSFPLKDEDTVLPLQVNIAEMGEYNLVFDEVNFNNCQVFLRDRQLGNTIDLLVENSYSFFSVEANLKKRFELVFSSDKQIESISAAPINVRAVHQKIQVDLRNGKFHNSTIRVFDPNGKLVASGKIKDQPWYELQINGAGGVYLVSITSKTDQFNQQIFVF